VYEEAHHRHRRQLAVNRHAGVRMPGDGPVTFSDVSGASSWSKEGFERNERENGRFEGAAEGRRYGEAESRAASNDADDSEGSAKEIEGYGIDRGVNGPRGGRLGPIRFPMSSVTALTMCFFEATVCYPASTT
jgi:hypothetical protein